MLCFLGPGGQMLWVTVAWFALSTEGRQRPLLLNYCRSPHLPSAPFLFYNQPTCRKDISIIIRIYTVIWRYNLMKQLFRSPEQVTP